MSFRTAVATDAEGIAALHADSWRRHYRGAYADAYLDGDALADRRTVWSSRLAMPGADSVTILAEAEASIIGIVGFVHVVLDKDERWGSLVDNLHVTRGRQRSGVGTALITRAARAVRDRGTTAAMYLWVLEQNTEAQGFYAARGGKPAGRELVPPPGGVPDRLNGRPACLRYVWPDVRDLLHG
ncbi:GNAT family N-acetyltransferase [Plantactinospora soyae]|uniref:GNAT superfamily N-acetyltransferase n=1 Tax=Plantactinospora soyae TaxID=1544732 RepID=A0A927M9Q3_9ACTN|nr:GNAT family N-acetyltransferase [Plantactinospora soyae]MBE1490429.1 GNAT superfamily N-acetyltransferase [Plantactinospora soyae]